VALIADVIISGGKAAMESVPIGGLSAIPCDETAGSQDRPTAQNLRKKEDDSQNPASLKGMRG